MVPKTVTKTQPEEKKMKRPITVWLLVFSLVFLALGGLYGGIAMLSDPSGNLLQMSEVLPLLHVHPLIGHIIFYRRCN